jgi:hypothetical protein
VAKRTSGLEAKILELEAELGDVSEAYETLHQTHADTLTQVRASYSPPPPVPPLHRRGTVVGGVRLCYVKWYVDGAEMWGWWQLKEVERLDGLHQRTLENYTAANEKVPPPPPSIPQPLY